MRRERGGMGSREERMLSSRERDNGIVRLTKAITDGERIQGELIIWRLQKGKCVVAISAPYRKCG